MSAHNVGVKAQGRARAAPPRVVQARVTPVDVVPDAPPNLAYWTMGQVADLLGAHEKTIKRHMGEAGIVAAISPADGRERILYEAQIKQLRDLIVSSRPDHTPRAKTPLGEVWKAVHDVDSRVTSHDQRLDDLAKKREEDVARITQVEEELRKTIADRDRRIAQLEREGTIRLEEWERSLSLMRDMIKQIAPSVGDKAPERGVRL